MQGRGEHVGWCQVSNNKYILFPDYFSTISINSSINCRQYVGLNAGGGVGLLKFGFGRDVQPRNLKVDPYKYQFFKKKWPIHIPFGPIFGKILSRIARFFQNFLKFEPVLAQIWASFGSNLENFWKINPFIYQILYFIRGHSYTKRLMLLPMLAAHPRRVFCTKYPPGPKCNLIGYYM